MIDLDKVLAIEIDEMQSHIIKFAFDFWGSSSRNSPGYLHQVIIKSLYIQQLLTLDISDSFLLTEYKREGAKSCQKLIFTY